MHRTSLSSILTALCVIVFLSIPAKASPQGSQYCDLKMTKSGNFFKGKTFQATKYYPRQKKRRVINKLVKALAREKLMISSINKKQGFIVAHEPVRYGKGKTIPFNFMVQKKGNGVTVDAILAVAPMLIAKKGETRRFFCRVYAAIGR